MPPLWKEIFTSASYLIGVLTVLYGSYKLFYKGIESWEAVQIQKTIGAAQVKEHDKKIEALEKENKSLTDKMVRFEIEQEKFSEKTEKTLTKFYEFLITGKP